MPTLYKIYLINQSSSTQTFWCFLTRPQELASDPKVFANSSASLAIDPNDPSTNTFTIPVQYVVGAGASNNAVGLNVQIDSTISQDTDLGQSWNAAYANVPPNKGPKLTQGGSSTPNTAIKLVTNNFNQEQNESQDWYASQSFGIETAAGFMGMTWSPSPGQTRTLTPKLEFYVNVGSFGSSTLADWTEVGNDAAVLSVPSSFLNGSATVTYLNDGTWQVTPGKPPQLMVAENLHLLQRGELSELLALSFLSDSKMQQDTVKSVRWNSKLAADLSDDGGDALTFLTGTITVTTALVAGFAYFVLSGVQFSVTGVPSATVVNFSYNGTLSSQAVHDLLVAGAQIVFGGAPTQASKQQQLLLA